MAVIPPPDQDGTSREALEAALREAEQRLRASEDKFQRIFSSAPVMVTVSDLETGVYLDANRAFCETMGVAREAVVGRTAWELGWMTAEDRDRLVRATRERGQVTNQPLVLRAAPDRQVHCLYSGEVIPLDGRQAVLSISMEVTEREEALAALRLSQDRFAKAFRKNPVAMAITSVRTGIIVEVNDSWCALTGLDRMEALGRTLEATALVSDPANLAAVRNGLEGSDAMRDLPLRLVRRDGQERFLLLSGEVVVLAGEPCMVSTAQDITELRRAEHAMAESEGRFQTLFEHCPVPLWEEELSGLAQRFAEWRAAGVTDLRAHLQAHPEEGGRLATGNRILAMNAAAVKLLGIDEAADLERDQAGYLSSLSLASLQDQLAALYRGDTLFEEEVPHTTRRGEPLHLLVRMSVMPGHERDLSRVLVSLSDLTDRRAAEAERQHLAQELNHLQRLESLGRLAGGISHDMNNVLGVIMAVASLLQARAGLDPEIAKDAETLIQAAARGRDLVKGLRDFSRKELVAAAEVDLNEMARREAELLERTMLKRVTVVLDLDPGLWPVWGEVGSIQNALMNLCINAVDAMAVRGTITLGTRNLLDGFVELAVQDDGEGMPPEVAARALEPFYTTKPAGKGTGLGLAQVYGTVKAHGGSLDIQSAPGQGTRVTLLFPRAAGRGGGAEEAGTEPRPALRPLSILLVDDEELVRGSVLALLQALGHRAQAAGGGLEALRRLEAGLAVDLVILDINMPGMDGVETLSRLRTFRPDLPVLLATGFLDERLPGALKRFPRVRILKKPFGLRDLERALGESAGP
jgi:PAS domain S-box-containing protein